MKEEQEKAKKGTTIRYKNPEGLEQRCTYDDEGNKIYYKNSNGFEQWFKYDDKGNLIYSKTSNKTEYWYNNGNIIHSKDSDGYEYWVEYDDKGNIIHLKESIGIEEWYDDKGNVINSKTSDDFEEGYDYDDKGNRIYHKKSSPINLLINLKESDFKLMIGKTIYITNDYRTKNGVFHKENIGIYKVLKIQNGYVKVKKGSDIKSLHIGDMRQKTKLVSLNIASLKQFIAFSFKNQYQKAVINNDYIKLQELTEKYNSNYD